MSAVLATGAFEAHDPGFAAVAGDDPRLVKVADVDAHEGPVFADGALYFTSLPSDGRLLDPLPRARRPGGLLPDDRAGRTRTARTA